MVTMMGAARIKRAIRYYDVKWIFSDVIMVKRDLGWY